MFPSLCRLKVAGRSYFVINSNNIKGPFICIYTRGHFLNNKTWYTPLTIYLHFVVCMGVFRYDFNGTHRSLLSIGWPMIILWHKASWDQQHMMTPSNGNNFRVTGHLCGEFTGPRWIPSTKASDTEFDVFFDLHPNKRLSKQWWGWWVETLSWPLWRHRNEW